MSIGTSRNAGPRCAVVAASNAAAVMAPICAGSWAVAALLVTDDTIGTWSISCRAPAPQRKSGERPPITTIGTALNQALVSPLTALVTPGPAVTAANPGVRVSLAVASAAKTAVASWRTSTRRIGPPRSAARVSAAASTVDLPPTAASNSGKMCAPDSVNRVSTP